MLDSIPDLTFATTLLEQPLLVPGASKEWDADCAGFGSIIKVGDHYRLYYTGQRGDHSAIGMAESEDGLLWRKLGNNPILAGDPGEWDGLRCDLPTVWREGEGYQMIYRGIDDRFRVRVGLASSDDGFHWRKHPSNPVFNDNAPWAHDHNEPWGLIRHQDTYVMYYTNLHTHGRPDGCGGGCAGRIRRWLSHRSQGFGVRKLVPREIGCALSRNLVNWTALTDTPIFSSSNDLTDWRYASICPYVFKHTGRYYLLMISRSIVEPQTKVALYSCSDPFFRACDRTLEGLVLHAPTSGWAAPLLDTPFIHTDDLMRDMGTTEELLVYFTAGLPHRLAMGAMRISMRELIPHLRGEVAAVAKINQEMC